MTHFYCAFPIEIGGNDGCCKSLTLNRLSIHYTYPFMCADVRINMQNVINKNGKIYSRRMLLTLLNLFIWFILAATVLYRLWFQLISTNVARHLRPKPFIWLPSLPSLVSILRCIIWMGAHVLSDCRFLVLKQIIIVISFQLVHAHTQILYWATKPG